MRIISGKNKGKVLKSFNINSTRPTCDMVKQALFNIIYLKIKECDFLDLFGGTGAVGLEAISRGAKHVFFIDNNEESINLIKQNAQLINATKCDILKMDYLQALKLFKNKNIKFDIIFIDPPYKSDFAEISINFILDNQLLKEKGLLIWEHDKDKLNFVKDRELFFRQRLEKM